MTKIKQDIMLEGLIEDILREIRLCVNMIGALEKEMMTSFIDDDSKNIRKKSIDEYENRLYRALEVYKTIK